VGPDFNLEEMDQYLLYRVKESTTTTMALWFHSQQERANILSCLRKVIKTQVRRDSSGGGGGGSGGRRRRDDKCNCHI